MAKSKPYRWRMYIRNHWHHLRRQRPCLATLLAMLVVISTLALVWTSVRTFVWMFQHSQCWYRERGVVWLEGPAHSMYRPCPRPEYSTLDNDDNGQQQHLRPNQQRNICITTLTDPANNNPDSFLHASSCRDFQAVQSLTWPNRLAYSVRHGYQLVDFTPHVDMNRPPAWSKIKAVLSLLHGQKEEQECDWVFWMDADTLIMNATVRLESLLPLDDNIHLIATSDRRFGVNSGAWLIRNSAWSLRFLNDWWNLTSWVRPSGLSLSGDNAAFGHLVQQRQQQERTSGKVQSIHVPARCNFNSFGVFVPSTGEPLTNDYIRRQEWFMSPDFYHVGDFVAHASGIDKKAAGIELLLKRASLLQKPVS